MALIKCKECGKEISDQAKVCVHCGYSLVKKSSQEVTEHGKKDTFALVGLILGCCSIIAWIIPLLGYPCTIIGIIFSALGSGESNSKNMATAGFILSVLFFIATLMNSIAGAMMYS